ncbi:MAG: methyltransferase domain-containing protein [Myxococcales bacterium]|nr:methyltransferase domain-containing protein [Myxococcales bacterium]
MDLREATGDQERRHPWEVARARHFLRAWDALPIARGRVPVEVLDVGAGDAWFAAQLEAHAGRAGAGAHITCVDAEYTDADLRSLRRAHSALRFDREVADRVADALFLLDVLEHVPNDYAFLRGLVRDHVRPGGYVLISVPAWPALYSAHDAFLRHYRRYTPAAARRLCARSGLRLVRSGGLFASLLAPRALARLLEQAPSWSRRAHPARGAAWTGGALLTGAVDAVLRADSAASSWAASRGLPLPGLSWWAVCRVPSPHDEGGRA